MYTTKARDIRSDFAENYHNLQPENIAPVPISPTLKLNPNSRFVSNEVRCVLLTHTLIYRKIKINTEKRSYDITPNSRALLSTLAS